MHSMRLDILTARIGFVLLLAVVGFMLNPAAHTTKLGDMDVTSRRIVSSVLGALLAAAMIAHKSDCKDLDSEERR